MCIGTPMRIVSCADGTALAVGRGEQARLNVLMVGNPAPGSWVLAFRGTALRVMSDDDAAQTNAALDALAAVLAGGDDIDVHFQDLIDREPQLPAHLQGRPS
jgi:hydrogenase expression/formation protein HypC